MLPPWRSTMEREIHSPSPMPPGSGSDAAALEALEDCSLRAVGQARACVLHPGADLVSLALRADADRACPPARTCWRWRAGSRTPASGAGHRPAARGLRGTSHFERAASAGAAARRPVPRASSITSARSMLCWRMSSWPDSMRTLSSRLSMSRVRRSVLRSSDSTSSSRCSGGLRVEAFAQQLDGRQLCGQRRAELVRDIRQHRVARAAHGLELGLVAHHLHLQVIDGARAGDDHRRVAGAASAGAPPPARCPPGARAGWGSGGRAGRVAVHPGPQGLSTSPQKRPMASSASMPSSFAACGFR